MGLFKKPNRKFRQRESRNDSEDESATGENEEKPKLEGKDKSSATEAESTPQPSTSYSASKERDDKCEPLVPKATKLLSFHDEEDGMIFLFVSGAHTENSPRRGPNI